MTKYLSKEKILLILKIAEGNVDLYNSKSAQ